VLDNGCLDPLAVDIDEVFGDLSVSPEVENGGSAAWHRAEVVNDAVSAG
jgi:hypothetical protein